MAPEHEQRPVVGDGGGEARGRAPAVRGLDQLTDHEYRTLSRLAEVHIPSGGPFPEGAADSEIAFAFDGFLAGEPEQNVKDLKLALFLVEYGPVIFERRLVTFSNLPPDERLAHWERWMTSDTLLRRKVSVAFRKFMSLVFYDQESVWPHIGYTGIG